MKKDYLRILTLCVVLLSALVVFSGCVDIIYPKKRVTVERPQPLPSPAAPTVSGPGEQELLHQAELDHIQSRLPDALAKYQTFLKTYPQSSQVDTALVAVGQIYEKLSKPDQATETYQELLTKHPRSAFADEARRRLISLHLGAGRFAPAAQLATDLLATEHDPLKKARIRILLGRAQRGLNNRPQALDMFVQAFSQTSDQVDKDDARREIKATLGQMTPDELTQAQSLFGRDFPGGYVTYVLAYRLFETNRVDEARLLIGYFLDNFPGHEMLKDAQALKASLDGQGPPPPYSLPFAPPAVPGEPIITSPTPQPIPGPAVETLAPSTYKPLDIACILPLSDTPASKYGQQVLKGLQLAFRLYTAQTPGFRSNLVVYDSKGDPALATRIVEQLAADPRILAVVGPVVSKVALQAAAKAEELALPMLTISQQSALTSAGQHVFRLFLTPRNQAQAVARYAIQVLGLNRLAVMNPSDSYGMAMRDYFQDEARRLGGQIVGVQAYNPKDTDFSEPIQSLAGVGEAQRRVAAGRKVQVHFDAVFIPDTYQAVAMIAPQFAYHDITTVRLLGTSLWHTPRLLETSARYVQRCIFPTAFFPGKSLPQVQRFVETYRMDAGDETAEPQQFEAYGYDAGFLLQTLMDLDHVVDRSQLVLALHAMPPFDGVTARFSFSPDGDFVAEPTLLTVEGEEFKQIQ